MVETLNDIYLEIAEIDLPAAIRFITSDSRIDNC